MMRYEKKKKTTGRPITAPLSLTYTTQHAIIPLFMLLLLLSPTIPSVRAQPSPNGSGNQSNPYAATQFSPTMAIIIAVLVTALFFMGFFSIYIRRCTDTAGGGTVRPIISVRSRRAADTRGLDPAVIDTFPTFAYSSVKGLKIGKGALECAVCLNEFEDNETLRLIPKCDHVFHPECVDVWLASHVTCPVCRADLVPQPGEAVQLPDLSLDDENQQNGDVSILVREDCEVSNIQEPPPPPAEMNRASSLRQNRPPRSGSVRDKLFGKFRSHSTGHSLVQPGENMDRFTLRLPEEVRKQVMNRAFLNRNASCVVVLPREMSSKKGYRTGEGNSSISNMKSYNRLEVLDQPVKSDRWVFSRAPSFLSRAFSGRSTKAVVGDDEGSSSSKGANNTVKLPLNCLQPKADETGLISADSAGSSV